MPWDCEWNRKIDKIEDCEKRVRIICKDGTEYTGIGVGNCQGTDENGDDVDAVLFRLDSGGLTNFIEDEIESFEILD